MPEDRKTAVGHRAAVTEPPGAFVPFAREEIEQSIPSRFEQQARLYPDRLAVKTSRDAWSYDRLNRTANRIAHAILARDGKGRTPVVVLIEQGAPHIAALLGVLKAGKFFVPLDPFHPASRLAQFVDEAQPTSIVTNGNHRALAAELAKEALPVVDFDALAPDLPETNPEVPSAPDDLAMILYTSGSTGRPKGVLGDHRIWIHNAMNYANTFRVCPEDRVTLLALGTSQAMKNLFLAILTGASVFPFDVRQRGLDELTALLRREDITITVMGASLFRSLVDVLGETDNFPKLRLIRLGSETLQKRDVDLYKKHFSSRCLLVNGLASGETQTIRFFCADHDTEVPGALVPVGYPVADKTILLLDDTGKEVGAGEVGEIVVESRYLASGYWRRPALTNSVFRPAETPGGPRRYYTGDLGRMDADGCLICLGRKNARVKIRGYGVDLLEIEMALCNVDGVKEAVVMAHQNRAGYAYLVAYIVPAVFPGPTNQALREALAQTLPDYMIPTTFVVLGALPRTTSGKMDRQALPAPGRPYRDPSRPTTLPRTPMETTIANIWSDVIGHETIDVHDHFYDLGGESLQAMRIMARIRKTFNVDLDLQSLVDAPTVAELSVTVVKGLMAGMDPLERDRLAEKPAKKNGGGDRTWTYLVPIQPGSGRQPIFYFPGGQGDAQGVFSCARLAHSVGAEYPFYALKPRSADGKEPSHDSVIELARDYLKEIRSLQSEGPYTFIGQCSGGVVAYEIAQQLRRQGHPIASLILLDTERPEAPRNLARRMEKRLRNFLAPFRKKKNGKNVQGLSHAEQTSLGEKSDEEIIRIKRSYSRASRHYDPRPYPGKITLLVSEELHRSNPYLGWKPLAHGGIEIYKVPGNHLSSMREHLPAMADKVRECLKKAGK